MSCETCILDKTRGQPFKKLSSNRYAPLHAVSFETKGPISQEEMGSKKYLQLLEDSSTGHLTGVAMNTKGGASDAIIRTLARLQALCGRTAKRLYTDGEKEHNPDIRKFLLNQGTAQSKTAPESSQSNGIVERRFESVFAAPQALLLEAPPPLSG